MAKTAASENARTMTDPASVERFLLAGSAVVTIRSKRSGVHHTYKVWRWAGADEGRWFVSVLSDRDKYRYMGMLRYATLEGERGREVTNDLEVVPTAKSKFRRDSPAFAAFEWFLRWVLNRRNMKADQMEVRHEGRCGRCGSPLTRPDSIDRGIGPDCWAQMNPKDTKQTNLALA